MTSGARSLDGVGRIAGRAHPEYGPDIYDLQCDQCGATWAGVNGEACPYCQINLELMLEQQAKLNGQKPSTNGDGEPADNLPIPINWHDLFAHESDIEWLVDDFWPVGRQLQIFAARKTGKSLVMLWIAANLAVGRDPFTGAPRKPHLVTYLDHEMTPDDILERVEVMGFTAEQLETHLRYYLLPLMPPLDTDPGGARLMRLVERDQAEIVVIDTLSRVVKGEENVNDTYMDFYAHTGRRLKRAGIALARLDHEGHEGGRARGASSKADDVDINWRLRRTDDGVAFDNKGARLGYVAQTIELRRSDEPSLRFDRMDGAWPEGTKAKADELDKIGAPLDVTQRGARDLLKAAGIVVGKTEILNKALNFRRQSAGITFGNHRESHISSIRESTNTDTQPPGGITPGITGNHGNRQGGISPPLKGGITPADVPDSNPLDEDF